MLISIQGWISGRLNLLTAVKAVSNSLRYSTVSWYLVPSSIQKVNNLSPRIIVTEIVMLTDF